jgi:acyl-CoA thioester hydrolase
MAKAILLLLLQKIKRTYQIPVKKSWRLIVFKTMTKKTLSTETEITVRFNEADPLGIVWHGHYIRYFEDGREAFGKKHDMTYLDVFKQGYVIPIVNVHCNFKRPLKYGDTAIVKTTFIDCDAAKIIFEFTIHHKESGELAATGSTTQVFLDKKTNKLHLTIPDFFEAWKMKWGLR